MEQVALEFRVSRVISQYADSFWHSYCSATSKAQHSKLPGSGMPFFRISLNRFGTKVLLPSTELRAIYRRMVGNNASCRGGVISIAWVRQSLSRGVWITTAFLLPFCRNCLNTIQTRLFIRLTSYALSFDTEEISLDSPTVHFSVDICPPFPVKRNDTGVPGWPCRLQRMKSFLSVSIAWLKYFLDVPS